MGQHWKLTLSYDGSHFHGWQVQPGLTTVQGTLAEVLRQTFGEPVLPQGSGRTDAGVHAMAQVASFSLTSPVPAENLMRALNRSLPPSIRILSAEAVDASFHARYSAVAKTYEYRLFQRRSFGAQSDTAERVCSPFLAPFVWDCPWPVSLDLLQAGAKLICGTHDFASFAASDPERSVRHQEETSLRHATTERTIFISEWAREFDLLIYRVRGNGFLHHMVRNLVGTFVDVGRGSLDVTDVPRILVARDRACAGPTAPARGLFLKSVEYSEGDRD